jgi:tetraacyldisaccharide-1-P 4'-kinase
MVGHRAFGDHHDYALKDIQELHRTAQSAGADVLVSTEKDWVKLARFGAHALPVWRVRLEVQFLEDDEQQLLNQILTAVRSPRQAG